VTPGPIQKLGLLLSWAGLEAVLEDGRAIGCSKPLRNRPSALGGVCAQTDDVGSALSEVCQLYGRGDLIAGLPGLSIIEAVLDFKVNSN